MSDAIPRPAAGRANQRAGRATEDAVARFYRLMGCEVYRVGRPGVAAGVRGYRGTMMSPGVPDLRVFGPLRLTRQQPGLATTTLQDAQTIRRAWDHEVKRGTGRLTPAQKRYATLAAEAGRTVVVGGVREAARHLEALGIVRVTWTAAGELAQVERVGP